MRRKPSSQGGSGGGYNNQQRKPRYQGGGSGGGEHRSHNSHHNSGGGRPRKNYTAMREKYLAQARDALASGDRVLAENYFQHADHCYRMMVEEGYLQRNTYTPPAQGEEAGANEQQGNDQGGNDRGEQQQPADHGHAAAEDNSPEEISQLPAFLTGGFEHQEQAAKAPQPVIVQNWEE